MNLDDRSMHGTIIHSLDVISRVLPRLEERMLCHGPNRVNALRKVCVRCGNCAGRQCSFAFLAGSFATKTKCSAQNPIFCVQCRAISIVNVGKLGLFLGHSEKFISSSHVEEK